MKVKNLDPPGSRAAGATRGHVARTRAGGTLIARDAFGTRVRIEELLFASLVVTDLGDGTAIVADPGGASDPPTTNTGTEMVPYYIPAGENFIVPLYKQAPFGVSIEVVGSLILDGVLVEVD